jgi:hypothetical protein
LKSLHQVFSSVAQKLLVLQPEEGALPQWNSQWSETAVLRRYCAHCVHYRNSWSAHPL